MQATRYILIQTSIVLGVVTAVVTTVLWLVYSLRFVEFIVEDRVAASTFFYLVILALPRFLGVALPIALFCAVLFVYDKLGADSELVVLRASGFSDTALALPALGLSLVVAAAVALVNLHYAPIASQAFKDLRFTIRNDLASIVLQAGTFKSLRPGLTFYVRSISKEDGYRGVLIHDSRNAERSVTVTAEHAAITAAPGGFRIQLTNGNRQEIVRDTGALSLLDFETYSMDLPIGGASLAERAAEPSEQSLGELFAAVPGDTDFGKARAEAHWRLSSPIEAPALAILALAALFRSTFDRRRHRARLAFASLLGIGVKAAGLAAKAIVARTPAAAPLLYLVPLCPLVGGLLLLQRRGPARSASASA